MMLGMHPWIGLADEVRLGLLTEWVSAELVDEVLAECGVRDQRPGALPARFMVYYVLALALFQQDSYDDVAENLVGALEGMDEAIPDRSSFTRARQRLGAGVIEAVFRRLAGPVAPAGLAGAFWRGMRVAAVDGFLLDVPDTPANRAAFGGPVAARGQPSGFPQARVVTLTETGTHSPVDARVGGYCAGEQELAVAMAGSAAGMLVIMDRGFPGVALWKAYTQARAHLLIRARSSVARRPVRVLEDGTYLARMNLAGQKGAHPGGVLARVIEYRVDGGEVIKLLTDLMDPVAFPAGELAALYRERWESEMVFTQLAKRAVRAFGGGREHVADLDLVAGDDHAVDEQLGQLPPLLEAGGGEAGPDGLAECLDTVGDSLQFQLLPGGGVQLVLLGEQGGVPAVQVLAFALEFGQPEDLGEVGVQQPLLLALELAQGLADGRLPGLELLG
jgi:Insertion element 4 transposase N-terminal/Transposase DDE domain